MVGNANKKAAGARSIAGVNRGLTGSSTVHNAAASQAQTAQATQEREDMTNPRTPEIPGLLRDISTAVERLAYAQQDLRSRLASVLRLLPEAANQPELPSPRATELGRELANVALYIHQNAQALEEAAAALEI